MFGVPAVWGFIVVAIANLKERVPRLDPGLPGRVKFTLKSVFDSVFAKCRTIKPAEKPSDDGDLDE